MSATTIELKIRGMDCAECATHIEERLHKIEGVQSAQVLLTAEKGIIAYDAARVAPAAFLRAIDELGYHVVDPALPSGTEPPNTPPRADASRRNAALAETARFAFIAAIAVLAIAEMFAERLGLWESTIAHLPAPLVILAILVGGFPILRSAFRGLRARQINADLLMTVAIAGASALGEFVSAALIVFFMSIAHFLENFTTERSRAAIRELVAIVPKVARIQRNGQEIEMPVDQLHVHDTLIIRPGERLPADGTVSDGTSSVDQSPITGESLPIEKHAGDSVFAGSVNQRGALQVIVTRVGRDSMLGKIIRLVEEAEAAKAPAQKFADRYSAIYLPVVIGASVLTYMITRNPTNAIAVLVVACPCAIALATPLAVVASVGRAARKGILIKGGLYLEMLAKVDTLVMDKTGTLTFGRPRVTDVVVADSRWQMANGIEEKTESHPPSAILRLAASAEKYSEHHLASAILEEAAARGIPVDAPASFEVLAGQGIVAKIDGHEITFGNRRLMETRGISLNGLGPRAVELERDGKTVMFLATDHRPQTADYTTRSEAEGRGDRQSGCDAPPRTVNHSQVSGLIAVADVAREEVPHALEQLRRLDIRRLILLTGDNPRVASALAQQLGVEYHAEMLPEDKIEAPALAQADVGIAMGVAGTDVAMEAAPIALMTDDWNQIPAAVRLARRAFGTIQQNIAFGLLFNLAGLTLASLGILTPVMAAAAQSLPDVAVFLNSSRLLRD